MFIYKSGKPDFFFVVYRSNRHDYVVPTGHVEEDETIEEAAWREVKEELGITPVSVSSTGYVVTSILENGTKQSTETAFLIEIPDEEVVYLETSRDGLSDGVGSWALRNELSRVLSYSGQSNAVNSLPVIS